MVQPAGSVDVLKVTRVKPLRRTFSAIFWIPERVAAVVNIGREQIGIGKRRLSPVGTIEDETIRSVTPRNCRGAIELGRKLIPENWLLAAILRRIHRPIGALLRGDETRHVARIAPLREIGSLLVVKPAQILVGVKRSSVIEKCAQIVNRH